MVALLEVAVHLLADILRFVSLFRTTQSIQTENRRRTFEHVPAGAIGGAVAQARLARGHRLRGRTFLHTDTDGVGIARAAQAQRRARCRHRKLDHINSHPPKNKRPSHRIDAGLTLSVPQRPAHQAAIADSTTRVFSEPARGTAARGAEMLQTALSGETIARRVDGTIRPRRVGSLSKLRTRSFMVHGAQP